MMIPGLLTAPRFTPLRLPKVLAWWSANRSPHTYSNAAFAGAGVVSQNGTTLTGVGSAFLSEVVIGDLITATGVSGTVTVIASDTSLTLTSSAVSGASLAYTITPTVGTSDRVSQVNDLTGHGSHITRSTQITMPTRVFVPGSGWAWRFDGQNDFFDVPAIDLTGTDKLTLVVVWNGNGAAQTGVVFENSDNYNTAGNLPAFIHYRDATLIEASIKGATGGYSTQDSAADPTTPTIVVMTMDLALTTVETKAWRNGTAFEIQGANANNTETAFKNQVSYIGARAGTSLFLKGNIYDIILCGTDLTARQRVQNDRWMAQEHAIAVVS